MARRQPTDPGAGPRPRADAAAMYQAVSGMRHFSPNQFAATEHPGPTGSKPERTKGPRATRFAAIAWAAVCGTALIAALVTTTAMVVGALRAPAFAGAERDLIVAAAGGLCALAIAGVILIILRQPG